MIEIDISTPALLFPAITLLLLAYTNRFLTLATLIRNLHKNYREFPERKIIADQLINLKKRIRLIKYMQIFGVCSFVFCVISMLFVFEKMPYWGNITFFTSLIMLLSSLIISLMELQISTKALEIELEEMG